MTLQIQCSCGKIYSLNESLIGKKARCQGCQQVFVVPSANPVADVPTPPANPAAQQQTPNPAMATSQPQAPQPALPQNALIGQPQEQPQGLPYSSSPQIQGGLHGQAYNPNHPAPFPTGQLPTAMPVHQPLPAGNQSSRQSGNTLKLALIIGGTAGGLLILVVVIVAMMRGGDEESEPADTGTRLAKNEKNGSSGDGRNTGPSTTGSSPAPPKKRKETDPNKLRLMKEASNDVAEVTRVVNCRFGVARVDTIRVSANGKFFAFGAHPILQKSRGQISVWDPKSSFAPAPDNLNRSDGRVVGIGNDGEHYVLNRYFMGVRFLRDQNHFLEIRKMGTDKSVSISGKMGGKAVFTPDNKQLIISMNDQVVMINVNTGAVSKPSKEWASDFHSINRQCTQLAEIESGKVKLFNVQTKSLEREVNIPFGNYHETDAISLEAQRIAFITRIKDKKDGWKVSVASLIDGKTIGAVETIAEPERHMAPPMISSNGAVCVHIFLENGQRQAQLFKVSDNGVSEVGRLKIPESLTCRAFKLSADGGQLFAVGYDNVGRKSVLVDWKLTM